MVQNKLEHGQRFTKVNRLRYRREIDRVFQRGIRLASDHFSYRVLLKDDPTPRLLVITSRKLGTAVQRNRIRRGVKEAFRTHKELFAGCDLVVIPRRNLAGLTPGQIGQLFLEEFKEVWHAPGSTADERGLRTQEEGAGGA